MGTPCGADAWTIIAALGTLLGTSVALAALVVAIRAGRATDASLKLTRGQAVLGREQLGITREQLGMTREQFAMAKTEHEVFLRELRARPELHVDFFPGLDSDASGYLRIASDTMLQATITLRNTGKRAAGHTHVEFFVPDYIPDTTFGWRTTAGLPLGAPFSTQAGWAHGIVLRDPEGREFRTRRIERDLDDVPENVPAELHVSLPVPLAPEGLAVPYRIRVVAQNVGEPMTIDGLLKVAPPDRSGGVY